MNLARLGFDAAVEFQPDGLFFPKPVKTLNDYGGFLITKAVVAQMLQKPGSRLSAFPAVHAGLGQFLLTKGNPTIITGSTPELYGQWLMSPDSAL